MHLNMQCHRGRSLDTFFEGILSDPPKKLAVIGCGCSVATEPVAEISHQWNISHVRQTSIPLDEGCLKQGGYECMCAQGARKFFGHTLNVLRILFK